MNAPVALMVELWFESEPRLAPETLQAAVPGTEHVGEGAMIVHPRFVHDYADGRRAAIATGLFSARARDERRQTRRRPGTGRTPAPSSPAARTASLIGRGLRARAPAISDRIDAYLPTLRAAIELASPAAVWCPSSERVVQPRPSCSRTTSPPLVNVRMFRADDEPRCWTRSACTRSGCPTSSATRGREPAAVAGFLYDLAAYLLERGDVIGDGDTVGTDSRRARRADAVAGPERGVLDLRRRRPRRNEARNGRSSPRADARRDRPGPRP